MSDWEPLAPLVLDVIMYHGRSTYGGDTRSRTVREFGSGDGPDSGLPEGMSHLELLEHSVLNAGLVARPMEGPQIWNR